MSSVARKMLQNSRSVADWVIVVLGDHLPKRRMYLSQVAKRAIDLGYFIREGFALGNLSNTAIQLVGDGLLDENRQTRKYALTCRGIDRAKELWWEDLAFKKAWRTRDVIRKATTREADILHDALIDAGASQEVYKACLDPVKGRWLMQMIREKVRTWDE